MYPVVGMWGPAAIIAHWGEDVDGKSFKWVPANAGRFDLEDIKVKSTDDGEVTTVVPTRIELGPSVPLVQA